jgi:hypothetical protein
MALRDNFLPILELLNGWEVCWAQIAHASMMPSSSQGALKLISMPGNSKKNRKNATFLVSGALPVLVT